MRRTNWTTTVLCWMPATIILIWWLGGRQDVSFNQPAEKYEGMGDVRCIALLDKDWCLVEIKTSMTYDNYLPWGEPKIEVFIPHIVRIRRKELDNLSL
jgi:hypothetical protein